MNRFLRSTASLALAATIALLLAACSPDNEGQDRNADTADGAASSSGSQGGFDRSTLEDRTWRFDRVRGEPVPEGLEITLEIALESNRANGRLAGLAACNRYTADFSLDGAAVRVGAPASTKRACPPPAMAAEARFLDALRSAVTLTIDAGGRLVLADPDGRRSIARPAAAGDGTDALD